MNEQLKNSMDKIYIKRAETLYKELEQYLKKNVDKSEIVSIIEKWMW